MDHRSNFDKMMLATWNSVPENYHSNNQPHPVEVKLNCPDNSSKCQLTTTIPSGSNLEQLSAMHIHSNHNNKPGPIAGWICTTDKWQSGVTQNQPGKNRNGDITNCCRDNVCNLTAPPNTINCKILDNLANRSLNGKYEYTQTINNPRNCANSSDNSGFLVMHDYDFNTYKYGEGVNHNKIGVLGASKLKWAEDTASTSMSVPQTKEHWNWQTRPW